MKNIGQPDFSKIVQSGHADSSAHFTNHLEGHLCREDELVSLKQASGRVHEDRVGDAVSQIVHPDLDIVGWCGSLDGHDEDHAESKIHMKVSCTKATQGSA